MRTIIIAIFLLCCLVLGFNLNKKYNVSSSVSFFKEDVELSFRGLVVQKFSTRDVEPTHLKVPFEENQIITISPSDHYFMKNVQVGDSVHKLSGTNCIALKNDTTSTTVYYFNRVSSSLRANVDFPKEWKALWLDDFPPHYFCPKSDYFK